MNHEKYIEGITDSISRGLAAIGENRKIAVAIVAITWAVIICWPLIF